MDYKAKITKNLIAHFLTLEGKAREIESLKDALEEIERDRDFSRKGLNTLISNSFDELRESTCSSKNEIDFLQLSPVILALVRFGNDTIEIYKVYFYDFDMRYTYIETPNNAVKIEIEQFDSTNIESVYIWEEMTIYSDWEDENTRAIEIERAIKTKPTEEWEVLEAETIGNPILIL